MEKQLYYSEYIRKILQIYLSWNDIYQHYYKVHDVIKYMAKHRMVNSNNGGREQIMLRVHKRLFS